MADRFVGVEQAVIIRKISDEQIQFREFLCIHELLQAFASGSQCKHVLIAQMKADPV